MKRKNITKLLTASLCTAVLAGMTAMPVFAEVSIVDNWVGSDYVAADPDEGTQADPGTAILTKKTITVKDVTDVEGRTVRAYQLVKGKYKDGKLTGYELCDPTNAAISNIKEPKASEITAIANKIQGEAANQPNLQGIVMTQGQANDDPELDKSNEFTAEVEAGLYIVLVSGTGSVVYNPAIVAVNITDANRISESAVGTEVEMSGFFPFPANAYLKKSESGLNKSIVTTDAQSQEVLKKGDDVDYTDTVSFKIDEMVIPSFSDDYVSPLEYKITDKLDPDGFIGISGLKVKAGTDDNLTELAASYDHDNDPETPNKVNYSVTYYKNIDLADGNKTTEPAEAVAFVVDFNDNYIRTNASKQIEITYRSTIRSGAKVNYSEHKNSATLTYSNDPSDNTKKKTKTSYTYHYTFGIDADIDADADGNFKTYELNKVTGNDGTFENGVNTKKLPGAEFTLYSDAGMTRVVDTAVTNNVGVTGQADRYGVATSDADGHISFKGLDAGTYYLKETKAPEGYTLNGNDYKIVITSEIDDETGVLLSYSVATSVKGENGEYGSTKTCTYTNANDPQDTHFTISAEGDVTNVITRTDNPALIINTNLASLPATGGMGTIIITSCAAIGMALFLTLFIVTRRKKDSSEEESE